MKTYKFDPFHELLGDTREQKDFYLATEADDVLAGASVALNNAKARIRELEKALREIVAIENEMTGGDWDEIERARQIASTALMER